MEKIQVSLVIEIMGRPPEHIKEALNTLVVRLGSEKGIKITNKTYHDPVPVEGSKSLFTAFAEVDAELDSIVQYFTIIFGYMPSHIEIVRPEKITLTNGDFAEVGNRVLQRLHEYDAITKNVVAERDMFLAKLKEVAPHLFQKAPPAQAPPAQAQQPEKKSPEKKKPAKSKKSKKR